MLIHLQTPKTYIYQVSRESNQVISTLMGSFKPIFKLKNQDGCHSLVFGCTRKTDIANSLADLENLYIPCFKGIMKKEISSRVVAILIIGGKLIIESGHLHNHGQLHVKNWRNTITIFQFLISDLWGGGGGSNVCEL